MWMQKGEKGRRKEEKERENEEERRERKKGERKSKERKSWPLKESGKNSRRLQESIVSVTHDESVINQSWLSAALSYDRYSLASTITL